jgi:hypothetical protein
MTCVHLQRLYQLCHAENLRLSSSDLVQLVCLQCGKQEVCPSVLMDEYDQQESDVPDQRCSANRESHPTP